MSWSSWWLQPAPHQITASGPCNLSNMSNLIEDWDHICFSLVFWATSKWPWDQPWGPFCHLLIHWRAFCVGLVAPQLLLLQKTPLISVLHPMRLLHAVWPDLQTPFLTHKSPSIPSDFVYVSQPALGSLPRKALPMPAATAVGICSQAAYKQNGNGNRSPKV